ncbi:DUF6461 domain-containing protein [Streptomyces sp. TRM70308]
MWCVTFTHGITPEDVLARYGADTSAAQFFTRQHADQLHHGSLPEGSVLRAGALGDWSFCFEDNGVMGAMPGPLAALSQGTETLSVLQGGDGMNTFAQWRDGQCTEQFEPGFAHTRPAPPHPWWDTVHERLDASKEEHPGLAPVLEAVADHISAVLDLHILNGPLLTLLLEDSNRAFGPRRAGAAPQPPGRILGCPTVSGPPSPPATRSKRNPPITQHTYGTKTGQ